MKLYLILSLCLATIIPINAMGFTIIHDVNITDTKFGFSKPSRTGLCSTTSRHYDQKWVIYRYNPELMPTLPMITVDTGYGVDEPICMMAGSNDSSQLQSGTTKTTLPISGKNCKITITYKNGSRSMKLSGCKTHSP